MKGNFAAKPRPGVIDVSIDELRPGDVYGYDPIDGLPHLVISQGDGDTMFELVNGELIAGSKTRTWRVWLYVRAV